MSSGLFHADFLKNPVHSKAPPMFRHGSLFSGIGGFDIAATWMGWQNVFSCERNPFCQTILKYYWPNSHHYDDIFQFSAAQFRGGVDIISGGFPCQPFSQAGKRKGKADDRYLFPEACRIITEARPKWIVLENVAGLFSILEPDSLSEMEIKAVELFCQDDHQQADSTIVRLQRRVIGSIISEISAAGYVLPQLEDGTPVVLCIPAAAKGAPHQRDRVWFVAHANSDRDEQLLCNTLRGNGTAAARRPQERQGQRRAGFPNGFSGLLHASGPVDLILIGGDIAFSGSEAEYRVADAWIKKICEITNCEPEHVLTVPGNHDIERPKLSVLVRGAHEQLKGFKKRMDLDDKISEFVKDKDAAKTLLSPLTNYNNFAQKYGSIPQGDNILYWTKDVLLDNSILRIRGVNSALVSDDLDNVVTSKLVLGSHQSVIQRDNGVVNLVLCHHPPDWLVDGEDVKSDFNARTRIQLFGHKHLFGSEVIDESCLVLAAGAMQPSRKEDGWEPRYNILELSIPSVSQDHILNVKVFKRIWKKDKKKFVAEFDENGRKFEEHNLRLDKHEVREDIKENHEVISELIFEPMTEPIINVNTPDPKRRLAFMFLGLPYHIKLKIALNLGLIDDKDQDLDEVEKTQAYFKRASERSLLKDLWDVVAQETNLEVINPFKI